MSPESLSCRVRGGGEGAGEGLEGGGVGEGEGEGGVGDGVGDGDVGRITGFVGVGDGEGEVDGAGITAALVAKTARFCCTKPPLSTNFSLAAATTVLRTVAPLGNLP